METVTEHSRSSQQNTPTTTPIIEDALTAFGVQFAPTAIRLISSTTTVLVIPFLPVPIRSATATTTGRNGVPGNSSQTVASSVSTVPGSGLTPSIARSTPVSPESPTNTSFPGSFTTPQAKLNSNRLAVIAGSTIGSLLALILLILVIIFFRRRRNRRRETQPVLPPDPFSIETREPGFARQASQFTSTSSAFDNISSGNPSRSLKSTNQSSSGPMSQDSTAREFQALRQRIQD
ncbi:hypothetical protein GALMADRAFT_1341129, partial [Galerina marginata CBS 339.88]